MNRITRLHAAAIAGFSVLSLAACGSSSSSNSSSSAPASQAAAPSSAAPAAAASKPATGSGGAAAGGTNTITVTGDSGATYKFPAGACLGEKSASGKLTLTASTDNGDVSAALSFDGSGKFNILLTIGTPDAPNNALWTGEAAVGAAASRTEDTVTFADVPIAQVSGQAAKASGTVKCESTAALL